jgi:hypothetical protein
MITPIIPNSRYEMESTKMPVKIETCGTCGEAYPVVPGILDATKLVRLAEVVAKIIARKRGGVSFCLECGIPEYDDTGSAEITVSGGDIYINGDKFES